MRFLAYLGDVFMRFLPCLGDVFGLKVSPGSTNLGTYACEAVNCLGKAVSSSRVKVASRESSLQPQ